MNDWGLLIGIAVAMVFVSWVLFSAGKKYADWWDTRHTKADNKKNGFGKAIKIGINTTEDISANSLSNQKHQNSDKSTSHG